ncbi:MAG: hypothetical protein KA010_01425 [Saprospiraceae bacterium]|nr:hypothetical protein [Saprospiraceae bacterium]
MNYTKTTLSKMEKLFEELGYTIRYEKGNFQSGYCLVENRKVAVVNKFIDTEGRINTLLEIFDKLSLNVDLASISEQTAKFYKSLKKELINPPLS